MQSNGPLPQVAIVAEADSGDVFGKTADWLRYVSVAETVGVARDEGLWGGRSCCECVGS
jgi:hypothetical protein